MEILSYLRDNVLLLDGGMGSLLYARGMSRTERSESWVLSHPEVVRDIHRSYYDAGSNLVLSNTFGANALFHSSDELRRIVTAAVDLVRQAADESGAPQAKFAALDIGPCGKMIKPLGDFHYDDAVALFAEVVRYGAEAGADVVFVETMYDLNETRAALQARNGHAMMQRKGPYAVSMVFAPGETKETVYRTPYGELPVSVSAEEVSLRMTPAGGELRLAYGLRMQDS